MRFAPNEKNLRVWQLVFLMVLLALWHAVTRNEQTAFFLGEPIKVAGRIWSWFLPIQVEPNALFPEGLPGHADIYAHLGVTLLETVLAFAIGTVLGLAFGLWLALAPMASAIMDPYIKALNSMPRVILAPIFALWFGLGIWSKVALAVTLVFFIVFFNVYQGVREVSPVVLANARILGANQSSCCAPCTCPARRAGCSQACTTPSAWPSSERWWASTSAPRVAWAT
jgi:NitT/TauT family transport system permease protein